jgi:hypothetical protein
MVAHPNVAKDATLGWGTLSFAPNPAEFLLRPMAQNARQWDNRKYAQISNRSGPIGRRNDVGGQWQCPADSGSDDSNGSSNYHSEISSQEAGDSNQERGSDSRA